MKEMDRISKSIDKVLPLGAGVLVDEAGKDGGKGNIIAPFTGIIKKVYTQDANEVWLQSKNKVEYADGTKDYMTIMFAHDDSVTSLYVGKEIKQGTVFYQEGTKGQASGNHVHFECGKGKFTGTGWHQDGDAWDINNGKRVDECLWIDDTYQIIDTKGYKFKNVKEAEQKRLGTPVARDEYKDQVQIKDGMTTVRARNKANGDILGYMNVGIYNILEIANTAGYTWYRVEENLWFAYSSDWAVICSKKEKPVEPTPTPTPTPVEPEETEPTIEELQKKIDELEYQVSQLNQVQDILEKENKELKEQLANQPKLIFTSPNKDYYAIELKEGQKLFLQ
jgi:murein DD-endopeptidase MepM/ murein hydrolase activator NlpD